MKLNPVMAIDFYKSGHPFQYPKGTEVVYSNFTARGDKHANEYKSNFWDGKVVFVGLQGFCKWFLIDLWNAEFFNKPKKKVIGAYKRRMDNALGAGAVPVEKVAALHDLGYLPLLIKALPEGSRVDLRVPFLTVVNTHPDFYWLTNYIETVLSDELWKPCTVATIAFEYRRVLDAFVNLTGASKEFADWQLHDFSMRGMSGVYDASTCGAAHLMVAGFGTDTVPAIDYLENYYGANSDAELVGGSVAATEHAVMCAGGKGDEKETIRRIIQDVYPSGIVSVVSDTWDFWNVITKTAAELKDVILNRTPNALGQAKVVFRPDSGDPVEVICGLRYKKVTLLADGKTVADIGNSAYDVDAVNVGDKFYRIEWWCDDDGQDGAEITTEVSEAEVKGAIECLADTFGTTVNYQGYKTLNPRVGLIYGDSITLRRETEILERLAAKGFAADNIVFGVGSYTYQHITRDTFGMAMKATFSRVNGEGHELFKDPATDDGTKKSAKGLLCVTKGKDGKFELQDQVTWAREGEGCLSWVFFNGKMQREETLAQIRARVSESKVAEQVPLL